jgi:hypothetical protein
MKEPYQQKMWGQQKYMGEIMAQLAATHSQSCADEWRTGSRLEGNGGIHTAKRVNMWINMS